MAIINQNALIGNKVSTQQFVDAEIQSQTPPDNITAEELNVVLSRILSLIEDMIQSTYNTVDKIAITNIYQGAITNTLDVILNNYQLKISPINTAFNKNFGVGGNSDLIPRLDDPRFSDQRVPTNNSVSTIKVQENAITNNKLGTMPTLTLKGNNTGITASPIDLTVTEIRAMLNIAAGAQVNYTGKNSITINANEYQLVNDSDTPGNLFYYGTDAAGVKGYHNLATTITDVAGGLSGDNWGNDIVNITATITNADTGNTFTLLEGNGTTGTPLGINTIGFVNSIKDIISNESLGDGWGTDVIQLISGGGLVGNGTTVARLGLDIRSNESLSGSGTTASNLAVDENWLTTFIEDYNTLNDGDGWGSQAAETSGFVIGTGIALNKIRLKDGALDESQLILWDFNLQDYKSVNAAAFANEFITLNTTAPIEGNGSIAEPLKLTNGTDAGNIFYWLAAPGGGGFWSQVNLSDVINDATDARNGITNTPILNANTFELGGTLIQDTEIVTNGNQLDLIYSSLPAIRPGFGLGTAVFGYAEEVTWEESLSLLGLRHGTRADFYAAVNPYIYTYAGIEHGDRGAYVLSTNHNDGAGLITQAEVKVEDSLIRLIVEASGLDTSELSISRENGLVFRGDNNLGIRYLGFNETDINTEGLADYSSLVFNSLVPKKYVDDAIAAIAGGASYSYNNGVNNLTPGDVRLGGDLITDTLIEGTTQSINFISNLNGDPNEKLYFGIGGNFAGGKGEDAVGIMYKDDLTSDLSYVIAIPNQINMVSTNGTGESEITLGSSQITIDYSDGVQSTGIYLNGNAASLESGNSAVQVNATTGDISLVTGGPATKVNIETPSTSEGLTGVFDYSSNYTNNSYVQKVYVDTVLANKASSAIGTIPSLDINTYVINHNLNSNLLQVQIKVFLSGTEYILIPASSINILGNGETITTRINNANLNSLTVTCNFTTGKEAQVIIHKII